MKELLLKGVKFVAATLAVVAAIWSAGWGAALAINTFFDSKLAIAETRLENKVFAVREADLRGINGRFDTLEDQQKTIIKQNFRILQRLPIRE